MKYELNKDFTVNLDKEIEQRNDEPRIYQVVVHNDDFTPKEFVVGILEKFFYMDRRQAIEKMMEAHLLGITKFGIYTRDTAETKISQVIEYARLHEHPLSCGMEAA